MAQTFEEMCAERDPLYAGTPPVYTWGNHRNEFTNAVLIDATRRNDYREGDCAVELLALTVRALRNQGQPYYD